MISNNNYYLQEEEKNLVNFKIMWQKTLIIGVRFNCFLLDLQIFKIMHLKLSSVKLLESVNLLKVCLSIKQQGSVYLNRNKMQVFIPLRPWLRPEFLLLRWLLSETRPILQPFLPQVFKQIIAFVKWIIKQIQLLLLTLLTRGWQKQAGKITNGDHRIQDAAIVANTFWLPSTQSLIMWP